MKWTIDMKGLCLASVSGILLFLAFPRFDYDFLIWISLVPLILAIEGKSLQETFLLSYLTGLLFFSVGISYWVWSIPAFNLLDFVLLVLYVPQYISLWGVSLNWIRQRTGLSANLIAPPLWVSFEYLRSHASFLSLPWLLLGHSQYLHPTFIQVTAFTGVYGLSFLIALMNTALADFASSIMKASGPLHPLGDSRRFRTLLPTAMAIVIVAAINLYGHVLLSQSLEGENVRIALIQGNVPPLHEWDKEFRQDVLDRYARLTKHAAAQHPALIVWPETAVPGDVHYEDSLRKRVSEIAREVRIPLLVGSSLHAKFTDERLKGKYYNTMVLFTPDGQIDAEYRKMELVPFGEYEPLQGIVAWPETIASSIGSTLAGDRYTIFSIGRVRFGAIICWESIFPNHFSVFIQRGARFMVSASNESWFGPTAAPYQLLAITVFRAAENHVAIARVANTGISAFIDPFGRITERLVDENQRELFVEGTLIGNVSVHETATFYARYGDLFAFMVIGLCVSIALAVAAQMLFAGPRTITEKVT